MPAPAGTGWLLAQRYRILARIGAGGMAEVFRAHDELLARDVAVKVFRSQLDPADSAGGSQRQQIELQALAQLSHQNLITLFDGSVTGTDGHAYLVMELVDGPSLAARIEESPLSEPAAREVAVQISDALDYVHARGMVHRDVKPANILLGTDATTGESEVRARLSDFGIVRLLGSDHLTNVAFTVGTASYLAPEQARGAEVGPAADVYALGLVLIEALTGIRAYPGAPMVAVMARLERPPEIPPGLPQPWPALLPAMTALDPADRPSA
ncbi:MAG: serine/threonine protein kinase, partial [Actinomycetota bacterium]|nr:serine/threonine protein kinase [Actinomycetota bacterium]